VCLETINYTMLYFSIPLSAVTRILNTHGKKLLFIIILWIHFTIKFGRKFTKELRVKKQCHTNLFIYAIINLF